MNRNSNAFVDNLTQAARDNPLAAALIGGGALWLMLGNRAFGHLASGTSAVAQPLAEAGQRGVSSAADALTGAGGRAAEAVSETARSMTRAATDAVSGGAAAIRQQVGEGFTRTAEALQPPDPRPYLAKGYSGLEKGYSSAQSTLTELLERQPLVLGAIGLVIGAGVASAVASTAVENGWAGSLSDDVKGAVKDRAENVAETAKRAAGEIGSEFRAAAGEAVDKLRRTGEEAVHAVKETAYAGRGF